MEYGCIGNPLSHSFSVEIHKKIGDYRYELKALPPEALPIYLKERDFKGINVTIPYKEAVIPYLDEISPEAEAVGAVNTVINKNGRLFGYNTDIEGLRALIKRSGIVLNGKTVAILGSGGTSKTAFYVCKNSGAGEIIRVSRNPHKGYVSYSELYDISDRIDVIINATPCGMFPNTEDEPVDVQKFKNLSGVADAVYNPLKTAFVLSAEKAGVKACAGLYMLVSQAVFAAEKFFDKTFSETFTEKIFSEIYGSKLNIVLTGMPSCGKSAVGKALSEKLSLGFFDTDSIIENNERRSIKSIFDENGEAYFRNLEKETVRSLATKTGCVISTGGGTVLDPENVFELKKNGRLYFLDRPPEKLVYTSSRPLSDNAEALSKLYSQRYELYKNCADVIIDASGEIDGILKAVSEDFNEYSCY